MSKKITGVVTSDVQDKTIVITVTSRETHPIYGKQYTVNRKYVAHDEKNQANKGDQVEIAESRPISKRKSWVLERIIETGHGDVEIRDEAAVEEVIGTRDEAEDKEAA